VVCHALNIDVNEIETVYPLFYLPFTIFDLFSSRCPSPFLHPASAFVFGYDNQIPNFMIYTLYLFIKSLNLCLPFHHIFQCNSLSVLMMIGWSKGFQAPYIFSLRDFMNGTDSEVKTFRTLYLKVKP